MTLIQRSIAGGVMIVVLLFLRRLSLNKLPKWVFVTLGDVTLLRLLISFSVPSVWSVYSLIQRSQTIVDSVPPPVYNAMPVEQFPTREMTTIVNGAIPSPGVVHAPSAFTDGQVWFFLWLAGVVLLGSAFVLAYVRSYRRFDLSLPAVETDIIRWKNRHLLRRPYHIRISQEITSPLTYGVLRPIILLPKDMEADSLDYVLTHEWTHIRRMDTLRKLLLALTLTIHWFNPLVWVLYWQMNQDIELACDEAVLNHLKGDNRKGYALTLLSMEERQMGAMPLYNGFSHSGTEERVRAIMKNKKPTLLLSLLAVILVAGVAVFFATSGMMKEDAPPTYGDEGIVMDYLTAVYTTDYEGRFTALQEARDDSTADMEAAVTAYMSGFESMVTPELLDKMTSQRMPYKYDGLNAEEHPWTVGGIALAGDPDTGVYEFRVEILSVPAQEPITGQVTVDPESHLISNFWEGQIQSVFGDVEQTDAPDSSNEAASNLEATAIQFLSAIYTTNHNARYTDLTEFLINDTGAASSTNQALEIYMSEFQEMVTPEMMDKLWTNRIPYKYDERNYGAPWTVGGVALAGDDNTGVYQFSVVVMNDEAFFRDAVTGQVTIDPETKLISNLWEGSISTTFEQEDYISLMPDR